MRREAADEATELLRTMLIVQLALAGAGQREIRAVAGCDSHRVAKTLKPLRAFLKKREKSPG